MILSISMTKLIGALVVVGVAQSCWYYVYLESPYDYYFRYCSSGCANLVKTDGNFSSCCMPYTSGQSTPAVCTALSSSYAAMGTTCTWGDVPTTDAPTSTPVDPTYTPPPYTPPVTSAQASVLDDCTAEEPDDTEVATDTFWITSTTTTPCSTTSSAAAPTSSDGSCDCDGEGGQAAQSTNWEGNTAPASFTVDNHRRAIIRRGSCDCSSATGSAPAETSAAAVTTSAPTATSSGDTCDCGGESGQAAELTNWEGNTAPTSFTPDNRRRRGIWQRGTCNCSSAISAHSEISAAETSYAAVTSSAPAPTSSDDSCTCGDESGQPAESTNWEGNTAPASFTPDNRQRRRGVMKRGKCDCGEGSGEAGTSTGGIVASSYVYEGNTAPATFTADNRRRDTLKPRNTAPASFAPDNRKRSYEGIVRGASVGEKPENEKRKYSMVHMPLNHRHSPDHHSNVVENAERKIPTGFSRYYEKRNTATTTTRTSTTWVITDDCGVGATTTSVAAATDTDAPVTASASATNTGGESGQAAESISAAEVTGSAPATTDDIPSTSVAWEGSGPPSSFVGDNRRRW
ncbi:hypothetical protein C356_04220 [Cryptococcus neoformans c45]|nr:hypothetical protein C356_04220 [Cryptococcus neoformans var. grubii c45]